MNPIRGVAVVQLQANGGLVFILTGRATALVVPNYV
jgi:hypothetical protein